MADIQLENGYTRIANQLLDTVIKTPFIATHLKIVLVCWRYMYGFHRKEASLSESFVSKATGISKRYISSAMKDLIDAKVLKVVRQSTFSLPRVISFNKNYEQWQYRTTVQQVKQSSTVEPEQDTTDELQFNTTDELQFHQETKTLNKTIKKDYSLEIENFRQRYMSFINLIDEYFDILRTTRASGKISDSVIYKVYIEMDKHPVNVVKAAILTVINNPSLHSKRENYFYGIMRNTKADEAELKIKKYETAEQPKPKSEPKELTIVYREFGE